MADWLVAIVVAVIGGPLMWGLARFDRRNTQQHADNKQVLERIEYKVDHVSERLNEHIEWHLGAASRRKDVA